MTAPSSRLARLRALPWGWVGAIMTLVAALAVRTPRAVDHGSHPRPQPAGSSASVATNAVEAERALLAPLREGSALGPATIERLDGLSEGFFSLRVRIGDAPVTLLIGKAQGSTTRAPVTQGRYVLFYTGSATNYAAVEQALRALAAAISHHEDLPLPEGLRPLRR